MSKELKGTKTEQNLHTALSGESQAYLRYLWFAKKAKEDGYVEISDIFRETAGNEKEHAEIWFKLLKGGEMLPTLENLEDAAEKENYEWSEMYKSFAEEARKEGFDRIAVLFEKVGNIEKEHEERFRKLAGNISEGIVFSRDGDTVWICRNCGHVLIGKKAPEMCPVCSHPKAYFEMKCENY